MRPTKLLQHTCQFAAAKSAWLVQKFAFEFDVVGWFYCQDIPTQIFHWDFFKQACKSKGVKPGKYLRPTVAEFLSGHGDNVMIQRMHFHFDFRNHGFWAGLPTNWTQPICGSVAAKDFLNHFPHLADKADLPSWNWTTLQDFLPTFFQAAESSKLKGISLFSGIAALELGLSEYIPQDSIKILNIFSEVLLRVFIKTASRFDCSVALSWNLEWSDLE